jgi:HPt (histidine-containing phosphotransfer) domain-containing protein
MNIVVIRWLAAICAVGILTLYQIFNFAAPNQKLTDNSSELIQPIPNPTLTERDRDIAKLGMQIFLDPNLSSNKRVSCESCHHIFDNGAENRQVSLGVQGLGARNSPTIFNVSTIRVFSGDRIEQFKQTSEDALTALITSYSSKDKATLSSTLKLLDTECSAVGLSRVTEKTRSLQTTLNDDIWPALEEMQSLVNLLEVNIHEAVRILNKYRDTQNQSVLKSSKLSS